MNLEVEVEKKKKIFNFSLRTKISKTENWHSLLVEMFHNICHDYMFEQWEHLFGLEFFFEELDENTLFYRQVIMRICLIQLNTV